ncbi:MAG TPA: hypothetical protein VF449_05930, partial [Parvibaculum sp.]
MRRLGIDRHGVVGDDAGLRSFDDQGALTDMERRLVLLRHGQEIAVLLAHDIFVTGGVLGGMVDDVADDAARDRAAQRAEGADGADAGL